jgi:hypothetical protein
LASTPYGFRCGCGSITYRGFPHSGIPGSTPVSGFPGLIAAYYALHRLRAPRHPPYALRCLTIVASERAVFVFSCQRAIRSSKLHPQLIAEDLNLQGVHFVENTGFEPVTSALQGRRSPS